MDSMNHTPGPWWYRDGAVFCDSVPDTIARRSNTDGIPPTQRDANMRLCAAAPELLDALRYMVANAEAEGWSELMLGEARAAIAKAEGRA